MIPNSEDELTPTQRLLGTSNSNEPRRRQRWAGVGLALAAVVAVAALAFVGGRLTAPTAAATDTGAFTGPGGGFQPPDGFEPPAGGEFPGGGPGGGLGGAAGLSVEGTITEVDGGTITLELEDGQTVTVAIGDETTFSREELANRDDLAAGVSVRVQIGAQGLADGGDDLEAASVTIVD
jgi:hypothetical protein